MALTLTMSTSRWELRLALIYQLEYRPVLVKWSNPTERGFIFKFLCFVVSMVSDSK